MNPFHFYSADTSASALQLIGGAPAGKFLAGGTTLIDLMKLGVEHPHSLIDINRLPSTEIEEDGDGVYIGALVRNSAMAEHPLIMERYPMVSEAILLGASAQLRNMATLGGNLLQRTRCFYFRESDLPCNKREPGSGCGAQTGYHRALAVLGTSDSCIANYPGDMAVPLAALDAVVHLESSEGTRSVPLNDFYLLPGDTPHIETVLRPGELITGLTIPSVPFAKTSRYLKVRDRQSYEFALASAAVALDMDGGTIREGRVALGGVGAKPWRSKEAEAVLRGAPANQTTFDEAGRAAMKGARPHEENAFKVELAERTVAEALRMVAEGVTR